MPTRAPPRGGGRRPPKRRSRRSDGEPIIASCWWEATAIPMSAVGWALIPEPGYAIRPRTFAMRAITTGTGTTHRATPSRIGRRTVWSAHQPHDRADPHHNDHYAQGARWQ